MPHDSKNASRLSSLRFKQAFESLSKVLGRSIVDLFVYDLERQDISLDR